MQEALGQLKRNELEAMEFYTGIASNSRDTDVARLMRHLADFEKGHHESLCTIEERFDGAGSRAVKSAATGSLPDGLRIALPDLKGTESLLATIEAAIGLELRAQHSLESVAELSTETGYRQFFLEMATEERGHYLLLKDVAWSLTNFGSWESKARH